VCFQRPVIQWAYGACLRQIGCRYVLLEFLAR
jgi:hypothetical protein